MSLFLVVFLSFFYLCTFILISSPEYTNKQLVVSGHDFQLKQHTYFMLHCIDSYVNEAFLQCQWVMRWEKCGDSRSTRYNTFVAPKYKTIFFTKLGNHTLQFMLERIPLSVIRTIASMLFSSHALQCDMGGWGTCDKSSWQYTYCLNQD